MNTSCKKKITLAIERKMKALEIDKKKRMAKMESRSQRLMVGREYEAEAALSS